MNRIFCMVSAAAVIAGLAISSHALALTEEGHVHENASGFCQSALPVFDEQIRKRATAVANEGTANAFVSCSQETSAESSTGIASMTLALYNRTAGPISTTCSLVHSFQSGGTIVPLTISVPANDRQFFTWTTDDLGGPPSMDFANFSCNLPPGVDIGYIFYDYTYEIGA